MPVKIDKKIVGYAVKKKDQPTPEEVKQPEIEPVQVKPLKRPPVLQGCTHKLTNFAKGYNLYVTVNYLEDKPFEVFVDGSHTDATQWVKALARLMSAMLRSQDPRFDLEFIAKELIQIHSDEGYHAGGKGGYVAGVVQHIGKVLKEISHNRFTPIEIPSEINWEKPSVAPDANALTCPECGEKSYVMVDGCWTCKSCGASKCG